MSLASPRHVSGRAIPPSVFPVVAAQRSRLGLRKPAGSSAPPVSPSPAPGPGPFEPSLFEPPTPDSRTSEPFIDRPLTDGLLTADPAESEPDPVEPDDAVTVIDVVWAEEARTPLDPAEQRSWWRRVWR